MAGKGGLSQHTLIYAAGNILNRAVSFLLIPLYTHAILKPDYGVIDLVDTTIALLAQLLGFNIGGAMVRFYFDTEDELERKRLAATTQLFFAAFLGVVTAVLALFAPVLSPLVFRSNDCRPAFRLAMAILFLSGIGEIPLSLMKAERRSTMFMSLAVAKLVFEVGIKVYLVVALRLGWYGALLGSMLAWTVFATLPALWLLRRCGFHFHMPIVKRLAVYCAPLILSGVAGFALHSADRFMLNWFFPGDAQQSLGEVGIYGLAYKLGYVMNFLILDPFLLIWFPYIFAVKGEAEQQRIIARISSYVIAAMVFGSFTLSVMAHDVVKVMAAPEYAEAGNLVPIVLLGYVFWALYELVHTPFFILKRTGRLPLIVGLAALTNIVLNVFWIPTFGALGAAWATVFAFLVLSMVAWFSVRPLFPVAYEWLRLGFPLAVGVGLYLGFNRLRPAALWPRLGLEALVILAFPTILVLSGFVRRDEWLRLKDTWHTIAGRLARRERRGVAKQDTARTAPTPPAPSVPVSHDR